MLPSSAARFDREVVGVDVTDVLCAGTAVHVYAGRLPAGDDVRVVTTAPDAPAERRRTVENGLDTWDALSGHPAITAVSTGGTEPRRWLAVAVAGEALPAAAPLSSELTRLVIADVAEAVRHAREAGHTVALEPADVRVLEAGASLDWPLRTDGASDPDEEEADREAVFRLGVIASEALTGETPALVTGDPGGSGSVPETRSDPDLDANAEAPDELPAAFAGVVARALDPDPGQRYASPYAFKRAVLFDTSDLTREGHHARPSSDTLVSDDGSETATADDGTEAEPGSTETESGPDAGARSSRVGRRTVLGALGVAGLSVVAGAAWVTTQVGTDGDSAQFSQFRFDAANTGYTSGAAGPTDGVTEAWAVDTGTRVRSSPVVNEKAVVVGALDDGFYAFDPEDGTERWTVDARGAAFYSAALGRRLAYLNVYDPGDGGRVSAVTLREGGQSWTASRPALGAGTPVLADGRLFAPGEDLLYAFDADDGAELWVAEELDTTSLSPAFADGVLYLGAVAGTDAVLAALEADDGERKWTFETDSFVFSSPAVRDGVVYAGLDHGAVYALDSATGEKLWALALDSPVASSPAVTADTLYVGSQDQTVYAVDTAEGEKRWGFETTEPVVSSPAVTSETVYVGDEGGTVYAIDAEEGGERWRFETGDAVFSSPAVVSGTVYIGSDDGHLYALTEPD